MHGLFFENFLKLWKISLVTYKPGTAQVGAISKVQKEQKDFNVSGILFYKTHVRKKIKFFFEFVFEFFCSSVSRIVPTSVKGGIWEFLNIHSLKI